MSDERHSDWWKEVPCHFNWGLEGDANLDPKSLKKYVERKLHDWDDLNGSPPCHPILLLGFLHVARFRGVVHNPVEAMKTFQNARDKAEEINNDDERLAFIAVCLANQLWTAEIAGNNEMPNFYRDSTLNELHEAWDKATCKMKTYMDAIHVFALFRLQSQKYKEAEKRCRDILKVVPMVSEWHQWLGNLIGRRARANAEISDADYSEALEESIECYRKSLEIDPNNVVARFDLALALARKPGKKEEACRILEMVDRNSCAVLIKKGRFYRNHDGLEKALSILQEGEKLAKPEAELLYQISCVYDTLAYKAGKDGNLEQKIEYQRQQLQYLEKTLQAEPGHYAMIKKAIVLGFLHRNEDAEMAYKHALSYLESDQRNLLKAQFRYAAFTTARNGHQVTADGARMYEKVISTATEIFKLAVNDEMDQVRREMKKYVTVANSKLKEFYRGNEVRIAELEKQLESFP